MSKNNGMSAALDLVDHESSDVVSMEQRTARDEMEGWLKARASSVYGIWYGNAGYVIPVMTPSDARWLLERVDKDQRKCRTLAMEGLKVDMENGMFFPFNPFLITSDAFTVGDGLNRITALSRCSDAAAIRDVRFEVVPRSVIIAADCGGKRSDAQRYRFATGKPIHGSVAAAIKAATRDFRGLDDRSALDRQATLTSDPFVDDVSSLVSARRIKVPQGVFAVARKAMEVDRDDAIAFFSAVVKNKPVVHGEYSSQAAALATAIINMHEAGRFAGGSASLRESVVRSINAWNAWRRGQEMVLSRYGKNFKVNELV